MYYTEASPTPIEAIINDIQGEHEPDVIQISTELSLKISERQILSEKATITFTEKEFEILHFLINNPNRKCTHEEIIKQVWGQEALYESEYQFPNNLIVHIRRIREKAEKNGIIIPITRIESKQDLMGGYMFETMTKPIQIEYQPPNTTLIFYKNNTLNHNNKTIRLSDIEFKLLLFMAKHHHQVLTRNQIVEATHSKNSSIVVTISNLRRKLPNNIKIISDREGGYYLEIDEPSDFDMDI